MKISSKSMQLERIVRVLRGAGLGSDKRRRFAKSYLREGRMERLVTENEYGVGLGVIMGFGYVAALKFIDSALENIPILLSPLAIPAFFLYVATSSRYEWKFGRIQNIVDKNRMIKQNGYSSLTDSKDRIE